MIIEKNENVKLDFTGMPTEMLGVAKQAQAFMEKRSLYRAAIKEISTKLEILDEEFQIKHDYNPIHHMESRIKSVQSTFEKLMRRGHPIEAESFSKIMDIAGIRVICKYSSDIYHIASLLIKQSDIELIMDKDYIKAPKESGYRSYHMVVSVPVFLSDRVEKVPVEVQIRTVMMDTWASLEHELKYKRKDAELSEKSKAQLKKCADQMNKIDLLLEGIHDE